MKLALGALLFAIGSCMLTVNAVPILLAEGFSPLLAAKVAGFVGIGTITGHLIACFLLGVGGGAEYDACAYLTARHFGMRNFGSLFGLIGGFRFWEQGLPRPSRMAHTISRGAMMPFCGP